MWGGRKRDRKRTYSTDFYVNYRFQHRFAPPLRHTATPTQHAPSALDGNKYELMLLLWGCELWGGEEKFQPKHKKNIFRENDTFHFFSSPLPFLFFFSSIFKSWINWGSPIFLLFTFYIWRETHLSFIFFLPEFRRSGCSLWRNSCCIRCSQERKWILARVLGVCRDGWERKGSRSMAGD